MEILKILRDNNIVSFHQVRGNMSEFSLQANIEELSLYDVLLATGEPVTFAFAHDCNYYSVYGEECNLNKELCRINEILLDRMKKTSLYEIYIGEK